MHIINTMHAIIINLSRFGDLLQTQPVITALHQQGYQVGLICLSSFIDTTSCLSHLTYVNPIPGGKLLSLIEQNWLYALTTFQQWIEQIYHSFPPDRILNITPHIPGRILAHYLSKSTIQVEGFSVDEYGFGVSDSMWAKLFEASTKKRGCSPYNLVDLFRMICHVGHIPSCYRLKHPLSVDSTTITTFNSHTFEAKKQYVGFQLGASAVSRQWPVSHFAQLGKQLYNQLGIIPVLFGSKSEQNLSEEYLQTGAPCINLIGKTKITELASILVHLSLLITNDTGTMHLAAGMGIPSLAIFLATAQPYDTGPYLEDCCCLEPALTCHPCDFDSTCPINTICRTTISADAVWPLLQYRLINKKWPKKAPIETSTVARVWLTTRDHHNFFDLKSLSGHDTESRSNWLCIQRYYYRQLIDLLDNPTQTKIYPPLPTKFISQLPQQIKQKASNTLEQISNLLSLLEKQGFLLSEKHMTQFGKKFLSTAYSIIELFEQNELVNTLGLFWKMSIQEHTDNLPHVLTITKSFQRIITLWNNALKEYGSPLARL